MNNHNTIIHISKNCFSWEPRRDGIEGQAETYDSKYLPDSPGLRAFNVKFENGARTKWHSHTGVQILLVEKGIGFVEQESHEPHDILPGDQIYIPENVWHRHGAKKGQEMIHLAITNGETNWDKDENLNSQQLNFIIEEYKSKVQYLKDHFTRMLTRFNYFIVLQAALLGGKLFVNEEDVWLLPVFGMMLSIFWYVFGAEDRYLVSLYRKQIEKNWNQIKTRLNLVDNYFTGQTSGIKNLEVDRNFLQWRIDKISTTHLTALFPLIIFILWTIVLLRQINLIK